MEHERVIDVLCVNAAFGTLREIVTELLAKRPGLWVEEAVSSKAPLVACCELARVTSCDLVLDEDDIFALSLHRTKYHSLDKIT